MSWIKKFCQDFAKEIDWQTAMETLQTRSKRGLQTFHICGELILGNVYTFLVFLRYSKTANVIVFLPTIRFIADQVQIKQADA